MWRHICLVQYALWPEIWQICRLGVFVSISCVDYALLGGTFLLEVGGWRYKNMLRDWGSWVKNFLSTNECTSVRKK